MTFACEASFCPFTYARKGFTFTYDACLRSIILPLHIRTERLHLYLDFIGYRIDVAVLQEVARGGCIHTHRTYHEAVCRRGGYQFHACGTFGAEGDVACTGCSIEQRLAGFKIGFYEGNLVAFQLQNLIVSNLTASYRSRNERQTDGLSNVPSNTSSPFTTNWLALSTVKVLSFGIVRVLPAGMVRVFPLSMVRLSVRV